MKQLTRELITENPTLSAYMNVAGYVQSRIDGRACGVRRLPWLALMADQMRAAFPERFSYLEIGTLFGGSLCALSLHNAESRFERYAGIDPFGGWVEAISGAPVTIERADRNIRYFGVDSFALFEGSSHDERIANRALSYLRREVHMIYIDGEHTSDGVRADFAMYSPFVASGGIVVFDDYHDGACPDVTEAIDGFETEGWNVIGPLSTDGTPTLFVMQKQ